MPGFTRPKGAVDGGCSGPGEGAGSGAEGWGDAGTGDGVNAGGLAVAVGEKGVSNPLGAAGAEQPGSVATRTTAATRKPKSARVNHLVYWISLNHGGTEATEIALRHSVASVSPWLSG